MMKSEKTNDAVTVDGKISPAGIFSTRLSIMVFISVLFICLSVSYTLSFAEYYESVIGTKHNFGIERQDACIICHTLSPDTDTAGVLFSSTAAPKSIPSTAPEKPIWNNNHDSNNQFSIEEPIEMFGSSLSCLSCHEDTTRSHGHSLPSGSTKEGGLSGEANHPIGIDYPVQPNGAFITRSLLKKYDRYWSIPDRTTEGMTIPSGPTSDYLQIPPDADQDDPLVVARLVRTTYGKVECDSCHDPHTNTFAPFLRADPKKLCLVCHNR